MKALSLTQPWASLVALGEKRIETRSWGTEYRGRLAIHATRGSPAGLRLGERFDVGPFEVERADNGAGLLLRGPRLNWPYRLPQGAIVATCELVDCRGIRGYNPPCGPLLNGLFDREQEQAWSAAFEVAHLGDVSERSELEQAFGDYTPGRYAWLLHNIEPIRKPIPYSGALGLWEWDEAVPV